MKKGLLILVLSLICTMTFAQFQTVTQWNKVLSDRPETFRTQLISSTENSIKVNVQVPGFYTATVTTPLGEANVITVPKSLSTAHAGEPDMPMTGIPLMIGDKARMKARVIEAQYQDFEGIEVAPSKGDFPRSIDPETVPYTYGECYKQDAFFPASNLDLYEPYIIRDFRGQNMAVYPFAYNPASKTLRVYYNMTVELYKVDNKGENTIESRRSNEVKMNPDFQSMYQRHFLNYEAASAKYTPITEDGDLLIICYDSYMSYMTDFVNWKKTRGINTTMVGTSTAGSTYSAIQTYIKNQYNANNNITHVLLVGDVAQIPGYTYSGGGSSYAGKGDNAYGQIVGSDIYNDVIIGRFSASSTDRVTTQCNRAITYERDLTTSATWLSKAEGISRKEGGSGHNSEDDYQHMDNIRTDLLNYGYSTVYQRYANLTGYDGSSSTISSDINSGVGMINYTNHGQETAWGANSSGYIYYANSHVNALTNDNKLPFIFSVACLVGKYDHSSDCFAEAWMNATNGSNPTGAIGTLMSYISQPWIPPMWAHDECIDIIVGSGTASNMHTYGGVSVNGLFGIFDNYSTSETSAVGTYQAWIVYGDPSLMIRTKTPEAMTVTHAGTITPSATSYAVTVSNGSGAVATITDASHNILGKATVSGTSATISLSGATLNSGDELTLCVFGYNKVTYLGTISVVGGTQYTITANASPTAGGTVTGGGTYYENTSCTLTATANSGYEFTNWKNSSNTVVSTNPSYTFTVSGNATYTATFTKLTAHSITCATVDNGEVYSNKSSAYKGETVTLSYSAASGYFFSAWNVKDASNNTITVTNNQFTMPDSNVTVSATFVAGYNVTLASVMNGTISADPEGGLAGTQITLTATPNSGYVFDSWLVYKTGDVNTTVTVTNNKFNLPAYDVTVVGFFSAPTSGDITVGTTNDTVRGWTLPTHVYYGYSLTQQIYTAAELNGAGTITAISFYYLGSSTTGTASSSGARTFDIYMSNTTSSNLNSWVNETSSHKVYTGTQTFNSLGWYTFTLDTPFEYDGTSNLLLTFDDNTGSYSVSSRRYFRTYSTGENRARYVCTDSSDFDPTAASSISSGAYNETTTANNMIKLTMEVAGESTSISVSPTILDDFTYAEGEGPSAYQSVALVGASLENNVTVTAPTHYEICLTQNGTYTSTLSIAPTSGNVQKMVYVRLKQGLTQGSYNNETLSFTSGSASQNVTLNGEVTEGNGTYYAITVSADPAAGGTVTGGNTYEEGSTATLTATANSGYTFVNWTKNGTTVSTNATYSFTVTEAATFVAHFSRNSYAISVVASPSNGGTVSGAGTYYENDECTVTATANSGYSFTNWTLNGSVVSTEPSYTFTVTGAGTYTANFTKLTAYTVTLAAVENGTISADQTTVYNGTTVTLTATPNNGYYFGEWHVTDANNNTITVTNNQFVMPASNVTVSATFVQGYVVTVAETMNGTVTATPTTALPGTTINLTATPDQDHFLSLWVAFKTGDVNTLVEVTNNSFTMPEHDVTVVGIFKAVEIEDITVGSGTNTNSYIPTYTYYNYSLTQQIYTAEEIGSAGTITAIAFKVSNSKTATRSLDVYLKTTSASTLSSWTNCSSSDKVFSGSVDFLASDWTTITLDTPFEYDGESNLLVCVDDNTGSYIQGSSNNPQFYVYSTSNRTLRYYNDYTNPDPSSISVSGSSVSANNQITFTMQVGNAGATLAVSPNNMTGFGYAEGEGPSEARTFAVIGADLSEDITVTAPEDYEVKSDNGNFASTVTLSATNSVLLTANVHVRLKAGLAEGTYTETATVTTGDVSLNVNLNGEVTEGNVTYYTIEATADPANAGTIDGTGRYPEGAGVVLTAYPAEGYYLVNWTENGEVVCVNNPCVSNATADRTLVAHFALKSYDITATVNPENAGTVTGTNTYEHGSTATLTATANTGYTFANWTNNGSVVSTNASYSFTVTEATNLVANFTLNSYSVTATADPTVGGSIIGTGNYNYGSSANLTATPANGYQFVNWTVNGEVVSTDANYSFTVDSDIALVAHFEQTATQAIHLNSGWNWASTYINLEGAAGLNTIEQALGNLATTITAQAGYVTNDNGWDGSLETFDISKMYQIFMTQTATVEIEGSIANPEDHEITLNASSWNWIGYPVAQTMNLGTAFANANPTEDDVVKSRSGFSSYVDGYGWWGSLNSLNPGEGYKYQSKASTAKYFTYPSNRIDEAIHANVTTKGNYWTPADEACNNISVMAGIASNAVVNPSEEVEIGAFVNGECRGSAKLMYVEPLDQYIAFLTVYGNDDETVSFRILSDNDEYEAEEEITFTRDAVVGKVTAPFMLHTSSVSTVSLFPNPVDRGQRVNMSLPNNVNLNGARIEVFNALGSMILSETLVSRTQQLEGLQTSGVYTVRVVDQNGNVYYGRLIVR